MRRDKATADLGGVPMAVRVARALGTVAHPVLAVGPEAGTGLPSVDDPREGPLRALAAGAAALKEQGWDGPALVLSCDVPFVTTELLRYIVDAMGDEHDAAVPFSRGRRQSLVAVYSQQALALAQWVAADGGEAMKELLGMLNTHLIAEEDWTQVAPPHSLVDIDTPGALLRARMLFQSANRSLRPPQ